MNIKIQKDQQKQGFSSKSRVLHMSPANSTTKGVGRPPKPPFQPDPGHIPTLILYKEPSHVPLGASKGSCYLFSYSLLQQQSQ